MPLERMEELGLMYVETRGQLSSLFLILVITYTI
jgi:hypothetical protein